MARRQEHMRGSSVPPACLTRIKWSRVSRAPSSQEEDGRSGRATAEEVGMGVEIRNSLACLPGSKGKNRNPLACLRNAGSYFAITYCTTRSSGPPVFLAPFSCENRAFGSLVAMRLNTRRQPESNTFQRTSSNRLDREIQPRNQNIMHRIKA